MAQAIDVSGLPEAVIKDIRNLVDTLRSSSADTKTKQQQMTPAEWSQELQRWANSHPPVTTFVDDSRESNYAGRGE